MADRTPALVRLTAEQVEAELLFLTRLDALRTAAEAVLTGWWRPESREALARALVDLAESVAVDARRADLLDELTAW